MISEASTTFGPVKRGIVVVVNIIRVASRRSEREQGGTVVESKVK